MFKTYVGPVESEDNVAYLRPETAQAIFAQFKNVLETSRQKVPFGIGADRQGVSQRDRRRAITPSARASSSRWSWNFSSSRTRRLKPFTARVVDGARDRPSRRTAAQLGLAGVASILGRGTRALLRRHRPVARDAGLSPADSRRNWRIMPAPAWTFCSSSRSASATSRAN